MRKRPVTGLSWYQTLSGQASLDKLDDLCAETLSEIFGYYAVEMGTLSEKHNLLKHSRITAGFKLVDDVNKDIHTKALDKEVEAPSTLVATTEQLPIATDNIDLVIASHTLEPSNDPHKVLREIDRILMPEGHCILIGFNPFSVPQLAHSIKARFGRNFRRNSSNNGTYKARSVARVRDWFSLLGFEVVNVNYMGARPALKNKKLFDALSWMERAGPVLGNIYVIHAKKQVVAMRLDKKVWRAPAVLSGGKVVVNNTAQKIRRQNYSNL